MSTAATVAALAVSAFDPSQAGYATPDAAALAGLQECRALSRSREYGGAIVERDGLYYFTLPATENERTALDLRIRFPAGAHLVALYHTHPSREQAAEYISDGDVAAAKAVNGAMYVGTIEWHRVLFFDPAHDKWDLQEHGSRQLPFPEVK